MALVRAPSGSASPVDPFQIRNSLFLTQTMRSPPQASINVIEHEGMAARVRSAKYRGIAAKAQRERKAVLGALDEFAASVMS